MLPFESTASSQDVSLLFPVCHQQEIESRDQPNQPGGGVRKKAGKAKKDFDESPEGSTRQLCSVASFQFFLLRSDSIGCAQFAMQPSSVDKLPQFVQIHS